MKKNKIFSGKIWNKVVRLASESEFNIETTSAIAGVRGTEFGIDAVGNELIVLSGDVSVRRKEDMLVTGTGPEDYLDIDFTDIYEANPGQTAHGYGTLDYAVFNIPEGNTTLPSPGGAVSLPGQNDIIDKYYRQLYSNNMAPRLNEADVTQKILSLKLIQKASNNPFELAELSKIHAYEKGASTPLASWESPQFTVNQIEGIVTINDANSFYTDNMGKSVSFVYEDDQGNLTARSNPHLFIQSNTQLTYLQIFGDWVPGGEVQGLPPQILSPPSQLTLGDFHQFQSSAPCTWTIDLGGGVFQGSTYYSVDSNMSQAQQITDIGSRFNSIGMEPVKVTCTNAHGSAQAMFSVKYEPKIASGNSGYKYSYFAGKKNWTEAKAACENLQEGGLNWSLPSIGDNNGGIDVADGIVNNETSLSEISLTCVPAGNICGDTAVFGSNIGAIWLLDDNGGAAYSALIFNQSILLDNKTNQKAFRCVSS